MNDIINIAASTDSATTTAVTMTNSGKENVYMDSIKYLRKMVELLCQERKIRQGTFVLSMSDSLTEDADRTDIAVVVKSCDDEGSQIKCVVEEAAGSITTRALRWDLVEQRKVMRQKYMYACASCVVEFFENGFSVIYDCRHLCQAAFLTKGGTTKSLRSDLLRRFARAISRLNGDWCLPAAIRRAADDFWRRQEYLRLQEKREEYRQQMLQRLEEELRELEDKKQALLEKAREEDWYKGEFD